jgi:CheY-like chemotaxis protein
MTTAKGLTTAAKQYRILIVEDDRELAEVVQASLENRGHIAHAEVVTGQTKLEAVVKEARGFKPDVILLDHTMPIDGTAFLAGFLADVQTRSTPVLLFSGADNIPNEVKRLVFATVRKPFAMDALCSLVENAIGMQSRAS